MSDRQSKEGFGRPVKNKTTKPETRPNLTFLVLGLVVSIVIFSFGYGLGSGRLQFGSFRLGGQNSHLPSSLDFSEVNEVYQQLRSNFDGELDLNELMDGMKDGLVRAAGDPYTEFFNPDQARELNQDLDGTFTGIGAELGKDSDQLVVIAPLAGFPAEKAGLRANDVLLAIDGSSTQDMTVSEAVAKIRGPAGTTVKLAVSRGNDNHEFVITRAEITTSSVEHEIKAGNIGYIKVSRFSSSDTMELARQAAEEFKNKKVRGIVLDLRNNPGGIVSVSEEFAGLWLPKREIVMEERRVDGAAQLKRSNGPGDLKNIPTIVLVNEGSASASEIVAGALRDHGLAKLFGATTFGKGSVQSLIQFGNGSILKVTSTRWHTPKGHAIDGQGLKPDREVKFTEQDFEKDRDPQLDAALRELR